MYSERDARNRHISLSTSQRAARRDLRSSVILLFLGRRRSHEFSRISRLQVQSKLEGLQIRQVTIIAYCRPYLRACCTCRRCVQRCFDSMEIINNLLADSASRDVDGWGERESESLFKRAISWPKKWLPADGSNVRRVTWKREVMDRPATGYS